MADPMPRLSQTTDIELVSEDFDTDGRRDAAHEILEFYDAGVRTFTEMEERGEWSRSLYQEVYKDHFRAYTKDGDAVDQLTAGVGIDIDNALLDGLDDRELRLYIAGYQDGFADGFDSRR